MHVILTITCTNELMTDSFLGFVWSTYSAGEDETQRSCWKRGELWRWCWSYDRNSTCLLWESFRVRITFPITQAWCSVDRGWFCFFLREGKLGFTLPSAGDYATGIFFIDTDPNKVNIWCSKFHRQYIKLVHIFWFEFLILFVNCIPIMLH